MSAPNPHGRRIGLFGGSFNPPHEGHRAASLEGLRRLGLDCVWWMVSPQNPLKDPRETDDFSERLKAARKLAKHPRFLVTDLEKGLGTRNTASTLKRIKPILARGKFVWIMGADSFATLHRWHRWRELLATLPVAVVDRPGSTLKALGSPAARAFAKYRVPLSRARQLPGHKAPAWVFLKLPLRPESSTQIRHARKLGKGA